MTAIADPRFDIATVRPLRDYVLLKMIRRSKSSGGIILPKAQGTECAIGEVIACGSGAHNPFTAQTFPLELERGDHVLAMRYATEHEQIEYRVGLYSLVRSNGIWAKVKMKGDGTYDLVDLEPRFHSVLVDLKDESETKGGILIANANMKEAERLAVVVKVGPGQWNAKTGRRDPCQVKRGDTVLMTRYAGADVEINGVWYRLIQEDDVKAIYEEDK